MENKKILQAIKLATNNEDLDFELAKLSMNEIMSGEVTPSQFGAFIIAMKMKGETPTEIAGLATAMRDKSLKIDLDEVEISENKCNKLSKIPKLQNYKCLNIIYFWECLHFAITFAESECASDFFEQILLKNAKYS